MFLASFGKTIIREQIQQDIVLWRRGFIFLRQSALIQIEIVKYNYFYYKILK